MAVGEGVTFTFSVYFPVLFKCVITSVRYFHKDHNYLCACLPMFFKVNFFQSKSKQKNCIFFYGGLAVIIIIALRYSVKSCPVLTALLFKCIFLRWVVS